MESYCAEENSFNIELENGYISVHVEYKCDEDVLTPTGRYFVYLLDPKRGSVTFHLRMNEGGTWVSDNKPAFINDELIQKITKGIETYDG